MPTQVAFGETDITPPLGTQLGGWLDVARPAETVRDPVYARIVILDNGDARMAIVSLDLLSIRGSDVVDLRRRIQARASVPSANTMIAATHNHAGPAIVTIGPYGRDDAYLEWLKEAVADMAADASARLEPAEVGISSAFEARYCHNRRWVTRDGGVITQPGVANPDVLYCEGPVDTELGVLCARGADGSVLGYVANWTCHPVHPYDMRTVTASWPGALARSVRERDDAPCVVLNGAFGNVHTAHWTDPDYVDDPDQIGEALAASVCGATDGMAFRSDLPLSASSELLEAPLRDIPPGLMEWATATVEGREATAPAGSQRYGQDATYARAVLQLAARKRERNFSRAEVQALRVGDAAFVGLPAEAFVETGLRIKVASPFRRTFAVGAANGMVGYAPPPENYVRGGYECTTAMWSKVHPVAADMMADAGIRLATSLAAEVS
jgi:neutral ceramidase